MLFLRSLEVFISSREMNLCRLDTWPTMVANSQLCATGYRLFDYFEFYSVCSCSYTQVSNRHELPLSIANKNRRCQTLYFFFKQSLWCFFRSVKLTFFVNSFISCGMVSPHIIEASDFAIRNVSFNQNKGRPSVMNLRSPGPVAGEPISVKVKCRIPFSEPIQRSVIGNLVHFKTKWRPKKFNVHVSFRVYLL